jgi:hypothetical protein
LKQKIIVADQFLRFSALLHFHSYSLKRFERDGVWRG